jgi:CHC2 zinc finger
MLTPQQSRQYFEFRLSGQRFTGQGDEQKTRCPFHDDRTPSLSVNFEKGAWCCHAGCGNGGILDFEERFSKCDRDTAKRNVSEILGEQVFATSEQPVAVYPYHDAQGKMLFEKRRYEPKRFVQCKPNGKGGYEYKLGDIRKPLYRLPCRSFWSRSTLSSARAKKTATTFLRRSKEKGLPQLPTLTALGNGVTGILYISPASRW